MSDEDKVRRIREALRRLLPSEAPDGSKLACSFCGKERSQVIDLIAGPTVYICNDCVGLCVQILEEKGVPYRKGTV